MEFLRPAQPCNTSQDRISLFILPVSDQHRSRGRTWFAAEISRPRTWNSV